MYTKILKENIFPIFVQKKAYSVRYPKPWAFANSRKNNHGCPQTLGYVKILATLYRVKDIYEGTRVCGVTKFLSLLLHGLRRL
jgi:hypothetical protein